MRKKSFAKILLAGISLFIASNAFAGNPAAFEIIYAPLAETAVPALSDLMLMLMGLLLAGIAFYGLRKHGAGQPLALLIGATIAATSMVPGYQFTKDAYAAANMLPHYELDNPAGGTRTYLANEGGDDQVENTSGVRQKLVEVNFFANGSPCTEGTPTMQPQCVKDLELAHMTSCYTKMTCN